MVWGGVGRRLWESVRYFRKRLYGAMPVSQRPLPLESVRCTGVDQVLAASGERLCPRPPSAPAAVRLISMMAAVGCARVAGLAR